jgi:hypothetical protein
MRRYLSEAVTLHEIPPPAHAAAHAETVEALVSLLAGMQVLATLTPKQHNPRTMRAVLDTFLQQLSERRARSDDERC